MYHVNDVWLDARLTKEDCCWVTNLCALRVSFLTVKLRALSWDSLSGLHECPKIWLVLKHPPKSSALLGSCARFTSTWHHSHEEEGYLLPTWAHKITCQCFDWMIQSSSFTLMTTGDSAMSFLHWLLCWLLHKWRERLSVTNYSSENNLLTFRLNAPVVIREKFNCSIQSKHWQVIFWTIVGNR